LNGGWRFWGVTRCVGEEEIGNLALDRDGNPTGDVSDSKDAKDDLEEGKSQEEERNSGFIDGVHVRC
jgi:hypothetical protein